MSSPGNDDARRPAGGDAQVSNSPSIRDVCSLCGTPHEWRMLPGGPDHGRPYPTTSVTVNGPSSSATFLRIRWKVGRQEGPLRRGHRPGGPHLEHYGPGAVPEAIDALAARGGASWIFDHLRAGSNPAIRPGRPVLAHRVARITVGPDGGLAVSE